MTAPEVVFHVSDVRVVVSASDAHVRDALTLVWGNAGPILPAERTVRGQIEIASGIAEVRLDGTRAVCTKEDAVPAFEKLLYESIPSWHSPPRVLLHAAAVRHHQTVFVLPGPSGCGKSSLALALVERGARYLTDELVVFDGERLWGVPRAPQFEPVSPGTPVPPWLETTDRVTYRYRARSSEPLVLPICRLPADCVAAGPYPPEMVRLVFPARGYRGEPQALSASHALARLLDETRSELRVDLGPLLARPALLLPWEDVTRAASVLADAA